MMKRLLFIVLWSLLTISITVGITHAQSQATKPRILSFTSNISAITPDEAESGNYPITLYWVTENVDANHRLDIQVWVLGEWHSTLSENESLPATGSALHTAPHTLDFTPPVWRLVILENDTRIVDQRLLKLRYSQTLAGEPTIVRLEAPAQIPAIDLQYRFVYMPISWEVINRPPNSNLRFTQLAENGSQWLPIELPRPFLWVRSSDEGIVLPYFVSNRIVTIRLEVYDIKTNAVYTSQTITVQAVGALSIPPSPTPLPTETVPSVSGLPCQRHFFFQIPGATYVFSGGGYLNWQPFTLCPTSDVFLTQGQFQFFENGYMLYRTDTNMVYMLSNNAFALSFPNTYTKDEAITFPSPNTPLEGIFAKAYAEHYDVAQFLGWPSDAAEWYNLEWQETTGGNPEGVVMTLPNGGRLFVTYSVYGGTPPIWAFINRND